jgi:hypothetical protein
MDPASGMVMTCLLLRGVFAFAMVGTPSRISSGMNWIYEIHHKHIGH